MRLRTRGDARVRGHVARVALVALTLLHLVDASSALATHSPTERDALAFSSVARTAARAPRAATVAGRSPPRAPPPGPRPPANASTSASAGRPKRAIRLLSTQQSSWAPCAEHAVGALELPSLQPATLDALCDRLRGDCAGGEANKVASGVRGDCACASELPPRSPANAGVALDVPRFVSLVIDMGGGVELGPRFAKLVQTLRDALPSSVDATGDEAGGGGAPWPAFVLDANVSDSDAAPVLPFGDTLNQPLTALPRRAQAAQLDASRVTVLVGRTEERDMAYIAELAVMGHELALGGEGATGEQEVAVAAAHAGGAGGHATAPPPEPHLTIAQQKALLDQFAKQNAEEAGGDGAAAPPRPTRPPGPAHDHHFFPHFGVQPHGGEGRHSPGDAGRGYAHAASRPTPAPLSKSQQALADLAAQLAAAQASGRKRARDGRATKPSAATDSATGRALANAVRTFERAAGLTREARVATTFGTRAVPPPPPPARTYARPAQRAAEVARWAEATLLETVKAAAALGARYDMSQPLPRNAYGVQQPVYPYTADFGLMAADCRACCLWRAPHFWLFPSAEREDSPRDAAGGPPSAAAAAAAADTLPPEPFAAWSGVVERAFGARRRVPVVLTVRAAWLDSPAFVHALRSFLLHVMQLYPDVWLAPARDVIDFFRAPLSAVQYRQYRATLSRPLALNDYFRPLAGHPLYQFGVWARTREAAARVAVFGAVNVSTVVAPHAPSAAGPTPLPLGVAIDLPDIPTPPPAPTPAPVPTLPPTNRLPGFVRLGGDAVDGVELNFGSGGERGAPPVLWLPTDDATRPPPPAGRPLSVHADAAYGHMRGVQVLAIDARAKAHKVASTIASARGSGAGEAAFDAAHSAASSGDEADAADESYAADFDGVDDDAIDDGDVTGELADTDSTDMLVALVAAFVIVVGGCLIVRLVSRARSVEPDVVSQTASSGEESGHERWAHAADGNAKGWRD